MVSLERAVNHPADTSAYVSVQQHLDQTLNIIIYHRCDALFDLRPLHICSAAADSLCEWLMRGRDTQLLSNSLMVNQYLINVNCQFIRATSYSRSRSGWQESWLWTCVSPVDGKTCENKMCTVSKYRDASVWTEPDSSKILLCSAYTTDTSHTLGLVE